MPSLISARSPTYKWWAFGALAIGLFASVSDHGSVTVALPSIADHFGTDLPTSQWVIIGYALTISALLMPMGRLSDIIGRKQIYVSGFAIFVIGAVVAGYSTSILMLILAKVFQGVGAAMTQGTSMAMVIDAFPDEERGKALGLQLSVVGTGGVAGPAMGGFLVGAFGWPSVFFVNVGLGLAATVAALIILDGRRMARDGRGPGFDWIGAGLSTAALIAFLLAVTSGHHVGWVSVPMVSALVGVLTLVGLFVWWEFRCAAPMFDVRLFKSRLFTLGVSASFISFVGMSSVRFLMPFYLQVVLGYSPTQVGLIIVPSAFCMIVMGPLSGRLSDRYGWRRFNVGGLMMSAAGLFLLSQITETSPLALVLGGMILQSLGVGTFNPPNNSSILSTVDPARYGVVSGFLNLVRNSGNVTSIALATAIVIATMASMGFPPTLAAVEEGASAGLFDSFTSGLRIAYLAMGSLVAVGIVVSFMKGGKAEGVPASKGSPLRAAETTPARETGD